MGWKTAFTWQWSYWRCRAAVVINNAEQSCGDHRVSKALPQELCEGQWHHCCVPGAQQVHCLFHTSWSNQAGLALGTKDVRCYVWAQKAPRMLWPPVPPLATELYTCDTQQIYGGCAYGTGSPKRRAKRLISIRCQCREAKYAKFWLLTCTENAENVIITSYIWCNVIVIITSYIICTILPEDATMAICTSSGKLVITSARPEDKLLTKQNGKKIPYHKRHQHTGICLNAALTEENGALHAETVPCLK